MARSVPSALLYKLSAHVIDPAELRNVQHLLKHNPLQWPQFAEIQFHPLSTDISGRPPHGGGGQPPVAEGCLIIIEDGAILMPGKRNIHEQPPARCRLQ
eukprot:3336309-Rhodomonas_salina.1